MNHKQWFDWLQAAVERLAHFGIVEGYAILLGGVILLWIVVVWAGGGSRGKVIVKLGGLKWTREDFCRGWLITGDTGSGKTRSGITPLLYQVSSVPTFFRGERADRARNPSLNPLRVA